ncbi:hypothetical protein M407DRAFT_81501 [Tulasnella calospora MUT 4182]|uniref:SEC7 domain-containing protein n=1 Tax=Tulasnella calospora MUT 4182 TaxID=1051891 RepID=A0A0C3PYQ1_9AGAM|nr:hypothetical protein M407DRAFT_81501 [Tulasnella calospora MUT 4182]
MLSLPASNGKPVLSRRNSTAEGSATASASTFGHVAPVSLASSVTVPKPKVEEETPEKYLARLVQAVSKAEIASVLASSSDDFHTRALRAYLARFDFTVDPLDVALRKLLMDLSLPKETQQIDRVMEAFAKRYEECNPGLFISDDHPYILAFSLMMLHTDAFNKSNKRKMTKADYVRNTRLPGVPSEVLDCFFDNITFAPFIFIEDPVDVNGQRGFVPEGTPVLSGMTTFGGSSGASPAVGVGGTSMFGQVKIDPYYLITQRLLVPLRKEVEIEIPEQNPFLYTGTAARWDEAKLQRAFAEAESVEIANPTPPRRRGSVLTLSIGNDSANADDDFDREQSIVLKVTKLGVLNRKEDLLEGGKRSSNRKWKEWSVLLTGSQLLFFKDLNLAQSIMELPTPTAAAPGNSAPRYRLPASPDEAMSVKDSVALFDTGYRKYPHAFRMLMPGGRQYLLHAPDEHSMNEWMALINYASTFKTAGLRMRPSAMTNGQLQQVGIAAATSWVNEVRRKRLVSLPSRQPKTPTARASTGDLPLRGDVSDDPDRTLYSSSGTLNASTVSLGGPLSIKRKAAPSVELEAPPLETADGRLEDTFFEVKAQLAVMPPETRKSVLLRTPNPNHRPVTRAVSLGIFPPDDEQRQRVSSDEPLSPHSRGLHRGSRNLVIGAKIKELEAKLSSAQYSLDSDVRIARNFAVLTPFLRSTRERLIPAIAPLAKRIRTMRMQVAMLICHRDILYADMAAEDREWRGTMDVALSAGAEFLKQKEEVQNEIPGLPSPLSSSLPRMTLSDFSGRGTPDGGATSNPMSPTVQTYGEAGRPSSEDNRTSSSSDGSSGDPVQALAKPSPPRNDPSEQEPRVSDEIDKAKEKTEDTPKETDLETRASDAGSERCEEWNKTKAAKRVSLAQLPSDRKLSALTLLSRHTGATGVNPTTVHEDDKPN